MYACVYVSLRPANEPYELRFYCWYTFYSSLYPSIGARRTERSLNLEQERRKSSHPFAGVVLFFSLSFEDREERTLTYTKQLGADLAGETAGKSPAGDAFRT